MCPTGRLWEERFAATVDCSSPLEECDVAEESRAIVEVLRTAEELLREDTTHERRLFNAVEPPERNTRGASFGRRPKPRLALC